MTKKLVIFTDGGSRGNPGPSAVGVVIKAETGQILAAISQTLGQTTNNVAEYMGVVAALEWVKNNKEQITKNKELIAQFFLDSKLVVNQLNGLYKVKENHLRELLLKVRLLEQEVGGNIYYNLIPREKNWEADALVNKALDMPQNHPTGVQHTRGVKGSMGIPILLRFAARQGEKAD